jgi:starvation-inducible outer membrane lipoprotein
MMRVLAGLLVLLLAACSREPPPLAGEPEAPGTAECRAEARASPEMQLVFRSIPPQQAGWLLPIELRQTETRLVRACLERKGLLRPGVAPVEPIR